MSRIIGNLVPLWQQLSLYGTEFNDFLAATGDQRFVYGLDGDDILVAHSSGSFLYGGGDDDHMYSGAGADVLHGGSGQDTADYTYSTAGVIVDLFGGYGAGGWAQGDQLIGVENVTGSYYDDILIGTDGANTLRGTAGADAISGENGDDIIYSGANAVGEAGDRLAGGEGDDTFRFYSEGDSGNGLAMDQIRDFNWGNDTIEFILMNGNDGTAVTTSPVWTGLADGFATRTESEIWYEHTTDGFYDITIVHARFAELETHQVDIILSGHELLNANDFEIFPTFV